MTEYTIPSSTSWTESTISDNYLMDSGELIKTSYNRDISSADQNWVAYGNDVTAIRWITSKLKVTPQTPSLVVQGASLSLDYLKPLVNGATYRVSMSLYGDSGIPTSDSYVMYIGGLDGSSSTFAISESETVYTYDIKVVNTEDPLIIASYNSSTVSWFIDDISVTVLDRWSEV